MTVIETHSGIPFAPLDPRTDDIDLTDIAHALSHQCRFSGHTTVHYSVAEHSVRVSELLEAWGWDNRTQLWGLLHDASEAYLVDLPAPLKADPRFAAYCGAERHLMRVICERFGLDEQEPFSVRIADAVLLATEARDLMPFRIPHWGKLREKPLDERIVPWSHETAKHNFLARFRRVTA